MWHDEWLVLVASALNSIGLVIEPLVWYRQHAAQQIGTRPVVQTGVVGWHRRLNRPRAEKLAPIRAETDRLVRLAEALADRLDAGSPAFRKLEIMYQHFDRRSRLPTHRLGRVWPVLTTALRGEYGRYARPGSRWYGRWLSLLGDLLE